MTDNISALGFNGEYLDSTLDNYHLGNGYRAYNPATMAFTAPDDMSPFGHGGINPYVYVSCDPINNTDPTGHFNFLGVGVNLGMIAFGIGSAVAAVATGGISLGATIAIAGALYGTYTGIEGIAKDAQQNHQGLSTEEAINLGVTVGTELIGWGAPKIFEKLSSPLAKVAENGPFKLSGGPEDAARAGEGMMRQVDGFNEAPPPDPLQHDAPGPSRRVNSGRERVTADINYTYNDAVNNPMNGLRLWHDGETEYWAITLEDRNRIARSTEDIASILGRNGWERSKETLSDWVRASEGAHAWNTQWRNAYMSGPWGGIYRVLHMYLYQRPYSGILNVRF